MVAPRLSALSYLQSQKAEKISAEHLPPVLDGNRGR